MRFVNIQMSISAERRGQPAGRFDAAVLHNGDWKVEIRRQKRKKGFQRR